MHREHTPLTDRDKCEGAEDSTQRFSARGEGREEHGVRGGGARAEGGGARAEGGEEHGVRGGGAQAEGGEEHGVRGGGAQAEGGEEQGLRVERSTG